MFERSSAARIRCRWRSWRAAISPAVAVLVLVVERPGGAAGPRLEVVSASPLVLSVAGRAGEQAVLEWSADLLTWTGDGTNYLEGEVAPLRIRPANQPSPHAFYRARRLELAEDCEPFACYDETSSSGSRCPVYGPPDIPSVRSSAIPTDGTPVKLVRVLIHVLANDDGLNPVVTPEAIDGQIDTLNAEYLPSRIQFLATWRLARSSQYRSLDPRTETAAMKQVFANEPERFHNVYLTEMPLNVRGFSTLPWDPDATSIHGGTVVNASRFGSREMTLVHELGHALGLWHTHHGTSDEVPACSPCWEGAGVVSPDEVGDRCSDTPTIPLDANGRPIRLTDLCAPRSAWPTTLVYNLMSAAPQFGGGFTRQQAGRMHAWIDDRLRGWLDLDTPAAPSRLRAVPDLFGEVHLTWTDNSLNETGFRIERAIGGGPFEAIDVIGANETRFTDLMPLPEALQRYRVVALNGAVAANGTLSVSVTAGLRATELYLDYRATGIADGTEAHPFPTVGEAVQTTGGPTILRIQSGLYPENLTLQHQTLRLEPRNGAVVLGHSQ